MLNPKTVEITLTGNVPSKKNSRVRTRAGAYIPSKDFYDWQEQALWQVRQQCRQRFFEPVCVDVTIIFGRKSKSDLDNRLTSVLDMLVEALIIRDDRFEYVPAMSARAEYRKNEPGAIIRITEVPPLD